MKNLKTEIRNRVVQVALPLPARRTFDYQLRREQRVVREGSRVRVPVQRREMTGMVIGSAAISSVPPGKLKTVSMVLDTEPSIPPALLKFLKWAADYYHHPIGEVIRAALPTTMRSTRGIQPRLPIPVFINFSRPGSVAYFIEAGYPSAPGARRIWQKPVTAGFPWLSSPILVARPTSTLKLLQGSRLDRDVPEC